MRNGNFVRVLRSKLMWLLGVPLIGVLLLPGTALSATAYEHVGGFGDNTSFVNPQRMAVHQDTGNLFLVDRGGNRVLVYRPLYPDPPGSGPLLELLGQIDSDDLEPDQNLNAPASITIEQDSGDIFIAKTGAPAAVLKIEQSIGAPDELPNFSQDTGFTSPEVGAGTTQVGSLGIELGISGSGPLRGGLAIGVNSFTDETILLVGDPQKNLVHSYSLEGVRVDAFVNDFLAILPPTSTFNGRIAGADPDVQTFQSLQAIETDSEGNLIVTDIGNNRVDRFDPSGAHMHLFEGLNNSSPSANGIVAAVDGVTDEVFITNKAALFGPSTIGQFDGSELRTELGPVPGVGTYVPSMAVASHLEGTRTGRLYIASRAGLTGSPDRSMQVYERTGEIADPPTVEIEAPAPESDVGPDFIDVRGSIDPHGAEDLRWWVEYRPCPGGADCDADWLAGPEQGPLTGVDPVGVETRLSGLEANMWYELRLVARNEFGGTGESAEPNPLVKTVQVAPTVATEPAVSIGVERATLVGTVNPNNTATSYWFEVTSADGPLTSLPQPPAELAPTGTETRVTAELTGLAPNAVYSHRLVALNEAEMVGQGDWVEFETRPEAHRPLFHDRGYERVSQADNNGIRIGPGVASEDGNHTHYRANIPMPGAENAGSFHTRTNRNSDGTWSPDQFQAVIPPDEAGGGVEGQSTVYSARSGDMSTAALETSGAHDPEDMNGIGDIYLRDLDTGEITWVSKGGDPSDTREPSLDASSWLSADGKRLLFRSGRPLLPGVPSGALYLWDEGVLQQVSPGEAQLGSGSGQAGEYGSEGAVSNDGTRVAFGSQITGPDNGRLFVWRLEDGVDGLVQVHADAVSFSGADREMETVIYRRAGQLYAFEVENEVSRPISQPETGGAPIDKVLAVSTDANRVYFATEATSALRDVWIAERTGHADDYTVELIARVNPGLDFRFNEWHGPTFYRQSTSNDDGSVFAFRAVSNHVPGRYTGGFGQVYVYESEADDLYCVSCPENGTPASGHASLMGGGRTHDPEAGMGGSSIRSGGYGPPIPRPRSISEDGTVAFQTPSQLLVGDSNSVLDVYEWRGGELGLVTLGRGGQESWFSGISADARTIFFTTTANPVPDGNVAGMRTLFAARAGGGYIPPDQTVPCSGSECREPSGPMPKRQALGSGVTAAPPEQARPRSCEVRPNIVRRARALALRSIQRMNKVRRLASHVRPAVRRHVRRAATHHVRNFIRTRAQLRNCRASISREAG